MINDGLVGVEELAVKDECRRLTVSTGRWEYGGKSGYHDMGTYGLPLVFHAEQILRIA